EEPRLPRMQALRNPIWTVPAWASNPAGELGDASGARLVIGLGRGQVVRLRRPGGDATRARFDRGVLARHRVAAFGGALQGLGAHRARRREQETLAEPDVIIEEVDHHAFALDFFGDEVDAEPAEQV